MTANHHASLYGSVTCSCGTRLRLQFSAGTASPVSFDIWCYRCGSDVAGAVELAEGTSEDARSPEPLYIAVDSIESRRNLPGAAAR